MFEDVKVKVCYTTGAEDDFPSAFISGLLKGCGMVEAHHNAINVSAYVCTQPGAMPDISEELKKKVPILA